MMSVRAPSPPRLHDYGLALTELSNLADRIVDRQASDVSSALSVQTNIPMVMSDDISVESTTKLSGKQSILRADVERADRNVIDLIRIVFVG
jgi:hypothetical protein